MPRTPAVKTVKNFPHKIRELPNEWITLPDGARLAARIWMPRDADQHPVPVILEYLPYRKRDGTFVRDELTHPYLAGHGYACVRVDMRGASAGAEPPQHAAVGRAIAGSGRKGLIRRDVRTGETSN